MGKKEKICTECGLSKELSLFYKRQRARDGLMSNCKLCQDKRTKKYGIEHIEDRRASYNKWRVNNPEKARAAYKKWADEHQEERIERSRKWRKDNPVKMQAAKKKWEAEHPEKVREMWNRKNRKQLITPRGKLNHNMASKIRRSLHGEKNNKHWESLVDYTVDQLKAHLEKLFKPGMTWENYGTYWHIDHKIPKVVFNFQHPDHIDFRLCWSLKNLQPLEANENIRKKDKLSEPFQPSLLIGLKQNTGGIL